MLIKWQLLWATQSFTHSLNSDLLSPFCVPRNIGIGRNMQNKLIRKCWQTWAMIMIRQGAILESGGSYFRLSGEGKAQSCFVSGQRPWKMQEEGIRERQVLVQEPWSRSQFSRFGGEHEGWIWVSKGVNGSRSRGVMGHITGLRGPWWRLEVILSARWELSGGFGAG